MMQLIKVCAFWICTASLCWGQTVSTLTEAIQGGSGGVCIDKAGNISMSLISGTNWAPDTSLETKCSKLPLKAKSVFLRPG